MAAHNDLGKWGEDLAADYLRDKGYVIIDRDWKSGHHDLDIVAKEDETLVIVEVKTRRNRLFGDPEEAVDYRKLRSLQMAINHYIKYRHINGDSRLDIITVVGTVGEEPEIEHIKDVSLI